MENRAFVRKKCGKMKKRRSGLCGRVVRLLLCICFVLSCYSCSFPSEPDKSNVADETPVTEQPEQDETPATTEQPEQDETPATEQLEEDTVRSLLNRMTLREKVGQLFLIRPDALEPALSSEQVMSSGAKGVTELSSSMRELLKDYPVGGMVIFGKNIERPEQISAFLSALNEASSFPLFLAVDEEGGVVARLANHAAFDLPKYKNAATVAAAGDEEQVVSMGQTIGAYLNSFGFNLDFAPVADVNTNPENPVIGTRAFSSDGAVVAEMALAMAEGLKQQGIIPTFKHFPGHGDTAEDSHSGLAVSYKTKEEMEQCEWLPYQSLTAEDCVMVGHIAVPELTQTLTPASMSYEVVTEILRGQLGFNGVVITDSLEMQAITDAYGAGTAAVSALQAGCDILLMPAQLQEAFNAVLEAVENGTITEERLEESVYRILTLKKVYGLW